MVAHSAMRFLVLVVSWAVARDDHTSVYGTSGPPQGYGEFASDYQQGSVGYQPQTSLGRPKPGGLGMRLASGGSGGVLTLALSKAATGSGRPWWAAFGACATIGLGLCGGRAGAAADALGVATLDAAQRIRSMDREAQYPIFKQIKSAIRLEPRRRFPPNAHDPWRYSPTTASSPAFSMIQCFIGAAFFGGFSVSFLPAVPFVPSSLCAILAALLAVFVVTLDDSRGDVARCFIARCIAILRILAAASSDAELPSRTASALRLGGSRLSALDAKWGVSRAAGRVAHAVAALATSRVTPPNDRARSAEPRPRGQSPRTLSQEEDLYAAYTSRAPPPPPIPPSSPPYSSPNVQRPPPPHQPSNPDWFR